MGLADITPSVNMEAAALPFRLRLRHRITAEGGIEVIMFYRMQREPFITWLELFVVPLDSAMALQREERNFCQFLSGKATDALDRMCHLAYLVSRKDSP